MTGDNATSLSSRQATDEVLCPVLNSALQEGHRETEELSEKMIKGQLMLGILRKDAGIRYSLFEEKH